ncbi:MAG: GxxExxY protein [Bacteroidetes bacterium]|jgi:GxxExxY protein|nr:GxxExxY protein [Bacteroidota bacterium]
MENNYLESDWIVAEENPKYSNDFLEDKDLPYKIIGICMDVHRTLGRGFREVVYKDAIELELKWKNISFEREKRYTIDYKGNTLPHSYNADFVVENQIILEVKAQVGIIEDHYSQVINYLAVSKCPLALIVNFSGKSLEYKRIILT